MVYVCHALGTAGMSRTALLVCWALALAAEVAALLLVKVRLWPAWNCVRCALGRSYPGTPIPIPRLVQVRRWPAWKSVTSPADTHIQPHQPPHSPRDIVLLVKAAPAAVLCVAALWALAAVVSLDFERRQLERFATFVALQQEIAQVYIHAHTDSTFIFPRAWLACLDVRRQPRPGVPTEAACARLVHVMMGCFFVCSC